MSTESIEKYLIFFASHCDPAYSKKDISIKIRSALERAETKSINFTKSLRDFISVTWGNFSVTEAYQSVTNHNIPEERAKVRAILARMASKGELERVPDRNGVYRKVDAECEPEDWQNAETESVPLWLPFGLTDIAEIPPGSIITLAGEPNAGKTATLMNIARENMRKFKIHYFSSEMGKGAFRRRAEKFPDIAVSQWDLEFYPRSENFQDVIRQGKNRLNVIDYLEVYDNFYLVSKRLAEIYAKLKGAIAIVAIQKSPGVDDGRGGSFTREKPVLTLAMSPGEVKITKLKEWNPYVVDGSPQGKVYKFKLIDGCRFKMVQDWHRKNI